MRFFLILSILPLFASFQERLSLASPGDYMVMEMGKTLTLFVIRERSEDSLIFEEISAPLDKVKKSAWADWVKAKAPGHTSWSMTEIDLKTGDILECYSFSNSGWVSLLSKESLFATLLNLPLEEVFPEDRRKIGPPPLEGEPDRRKEWNPPLTFEGQPITNPSFDVRLTHWPEDESELSSKAITLYFDRQNRSALPFWIEVETTHLLATARTVDAGKDLPEIYRTLPRRPPEFVRIAPNSLLLKCPRASRSFELFAVDISSETKQIFPVNFILKEKSADLVSLQLDPDELKNTFTPNHRYRWLLAPHGKGNFTESLHNFVWNPNE